MSVKEAVLLAKFRRFSLRPQPLSLAMLTLFVSVVFMFIAGSTANAVDNTPTVGFYTPKSLPAGMKSVEPLIKDFWNRWIAISPIYAENWPKCLTMKTDQLVGNHPIIFLADSASAVEKNVNARNQNCEISSNEAIFFPSYNGICDTGEFRNYTPSQLLQCAIGTNEGIKLMNLKIDGVDESDKIFHANTSMPFIWSIPKVNFYQMTEPHVGNHPAMAEGYYAFLKPLPVGVHTIELKVLRVPPEPNQPVEHPNLKYTLNVVPSK
jgi:hypothetical protein